MSPTADGPRPEPPADPALEVPHAVLDADEMAAILRARGVAEETIADARDHDHLELLTIERFVVPELAGHDLDAVARATALRPEVIAQLWRSLGFPQPRPDDPMFTEVDVEVLGTIGALLEAGLIDDELTIQMARVIGSSLSRVAASIIDAVDPSEPRSRRRPSFDPDDPDSVVLLLFPTVSRIIDLVWRRHVQAQARARMARDHADGMPDHQVVGFADLVGFTALSQQITAHELAGVVDRFEGIAYDTVARSGGRVVKMIGDEVMFAVADEADAAEIALSLSETYREDDELSDVRVGLAAGPALQREGDLFGPTVNRASRIVNLAFPGTVVCSHELHDVLTEAPGLRWKPIGVRNLKNIGRVPLFVLRRAGESDRPRTSRERAERRRAERREARVTELEAGRGGDPGPVSPEAGRT